MKTLDQLLQIYRTGSGHLSQAATDSTRLPAGHPEGFIEALAKINLNFANVVDEVLAVSTSLLTMITRPLPKEYAAWLS